MKLYVVEVEVDDSSEIGQDDEFIRSEIAGALEEIPGVVGVIIDDLYR